MHEWREIALAEIADVSWGDTSTTKSRYTSSGYTAYSASGPDGLLPYFDHDRDAVIISAIGAQCGKTWHARGQWSCIKNTLWMRAHPGVADTGFLYYTTRRPNFWPRRGAAQPFISQGDARATRVALPPLGVQLRIAAALAAFDELIEINERRIELLEDLARSLYCEWFVRFRFPGHEDAQFVDSELGPIPAGWGPQPVASVAEFLNGFAFKPSDWGSHGLPIIKIKQLKQGVAPDTPRYGGDDLPCKFTVIPGDLLFSWSANLGVYLWPDERGLLNQHLFKVTARDEVSHEFLFHALDDALPQFRARAQGTTMKHIKRSALSEVSVVVPTPSVLHDFSAAVAPLHAERLALAREVTLLAATRDLLLPRLVTGRLDISDIDLGDLLPAEAA